MLSLIYSPSSVMFSCDAQATLSFTKNHNCRRRCHPPATPLPPLNCKLTCVLCDRHMRFHAEAGCRVFSYIMLQKMKTVLQLASRSQPIHLISQNLNMKPDFDGS